MRGFLLGIRYLNLRPCRPAIYAIVLENDCVDKRSLTSVIRYRDG
jgi:hypothetical protein